MSSDADGLAPNETEAPEDPWRVLVVEDDADQARALERLLVHFGFSVTVAQDGSQGCEQLERVRPHVITLDLELPRGGGLAVLHALRAEPSLAKTRVLVVSGMGRAEFELARSLGADAVLAKPFANRDLVELVAGMVGMEIPDD